MGEMIRFLSVGGLATVVSFVGFNALVHGLFLGGAPLSRLPVLAFVLVNFAAGWVATSACGRGRSKGAMSATRSRG